MAMTEKELIAAEESKIEAADISEITYQTSDHEIEKQLLVGVGFEPVRATEQYTLYQRSNTLALLIGTWVIQGSAEYIIDQLTETFDFAISIETDLWNLLLDLIKGAGI